MTIYNLAIRLYNLGIFLKSLSNEKVRLIRKGRLDTLRSLNTVLHSTKKKVWIHCASLGEFEQGRPVIEFLKEKGYYIIVTFFSSSGYEVRKNYAYADKILYLPSDKPSNARRFVNSINPDLAIFVKYEFWANYILELQKKAITTISISAIFRENQFYFKDSGKFYRVILQKLDKIFTQDDNSLVILKNYNFGNAVVAGDTRFDRVVDIKNENFSDEKIRVFKGEERIMVIGSSWEADITLLSKFINDKAETMKFIIAPHNINESDLLVIEKTSNHELVRYSQTNELKFKTARIMILDTIGILSKVYSYGDYAYVGGAFGEGLHNILEPATFSLPVFFGNQNYKKFKEATDLENEGGAFPVGNYLELSECFRKIENEESRKRVGKICFEYICKSTGATKTITKYCEAILKNEQL